MDRFGTSSEGIGRPPSRYGRIIYSKCPLQPPVRRQAEFRVLTLSCGPWDRATAGPARSAAGSLSQCHASEPPLRLPSRASEPDSADSSPSHWPHAAAAGFKLSDGTRDPALRVMLAGRRLSLNPLMSRAQPAASGRLDSESVSL